MSFASRISKPRASIRPRISPASRRRTASGLIRMRLRSTATSAPAAGAPSPPRAERRRCSRHRRLDRRLAVRADLPDRLERRLAAHARLLQLRRAHRADEEAGIDTGSADGAVEVLLSQPFLHLPDLELALANVVEVLGRAKEHVDDRADEGN